MRLSLADLYLPVTAATLTLLVSRCPQIKCPHCTLTSTPTLVPGSLLLTSSRWSTLMPSCHSTVLRPSSARPYASLSRLGQEIPSQFFLHIPAPLLRRKLSRKSMCD